MSALDDRRRWLVHLHGCTRCPVDLCDRGLELAAAVQATLAPGESWEGVWAPTEAQQAARMSPRDIEDFKAAKRLAAELE